MAITIIVEDGTGKPDSNSYNTPQEVSAYLEQRGVVPPAEQSLYALIVLATDWLECLPFKGSKTNEAQALQYPRTGVFLNGSTLPPTEIPQALKRAHAQLVMDTVKDKAPLLSGVPEYALKMRKLGPLTQEWAVGSSGQVKQQHPHTVVWSALRPLLSGAGTGGVIR